MMNNITGSCPNCGGEVPHGHKYCTDNCGRQYRNRLAWQREKEKRLALARATRASFAVFGNKKPRAKMYRRGTLDMPKCQVEGCKNHLYWNCERLWGICIHHHNLKKRRNAPRVDTFIPRASYAQG